MTAWKAKARAVTYPAMEIPPGPPPMEINDDFEDQPAGSRPSGAVSHVENLGDAIVVTDETAASGKHSVKIVDAPGLRNAFDPHLTYENLGHVTGRVWNSFDLRVAKDTRMNFEWRDYGVPPYATGPQFALNDMLLTFGNGQKLALPADTWIHFEIVAALGDAARRWLDAARDRARPTAPRVSQASAWRIRGSRSSIGSALPATQRIKRHSISIIWC